MGRCPSVCLSVNMRTNSDRKSYDHHFWSVDSLQAYAEETFLAQLIEQSSKLSSCDACGVRLAVRHEGTNLNGLTDHPQIFFVHPLGQYGELKFLFF